MTKLARETGNRRGPFGGPSVLTSDSAGDCPTTHGYVKASDGTRLFYSVEGTGYPLVFCYGLVCSSLHWTYQIQHFRKNYQTIWLDYRGHGRSDTPKDVSTVTIENIAKDVMSVLDELSVKKAVFLGHSMGVNVVLEIWNQFASRMDGMILANGTPTRPMESFMSTNMMEPGFKILGTAYKTLPALVEKLWKTQANNPIAHTIVSILGFNAHLTPPEDIQKYINLVSEVDPGLFVQLIENYNTHDLSSRLHEIEVPTLIIGGEKDHMTPIQNQRLMHQVISGSEMEVIKHGSHCTQMDLPDLVNMRIEKFLKDRVKV